jgi:hypothetical protein
MKFVGGFESGPLMPKMASWMRSPGLTSRPMTRRFGAFHPLMTEPPRQLAVDPDLRVVVERGLEFDGRAGGIVRADPIGDRDRDAIPVEREAAGAATLHQRRRIDRRPGGIVEIRDASFRRVVVRADGCAGWLPIGAGADEIDLDDLRVAVAPGAAHEREAVGCREIDRGLGAGLLGREGGRDRDRRDPDRREHACAGARDACRIREPAARVHRVPPAGAVTFTT